MTNSIYHTLYLSINQQKWLNHYRLLCERAKSREISGYVECHHILPKCMGGSNEDDNLVKLSPEEHYVAHQLLVKIFPENYKLVYAALFMSGDVKGRRKISNKHFGWLRRKHSLNRKGKTKDICPIAKKISEQMIGQNLQNSERVRKSAATRRGRTKENCQKTFETAIKISKTLTGRTKETHEHLLQTSIALTGRTKENYEYIEKVAKMKRKITPEIKLFLCQERQFSTSFYKISEKIKNIFGISISAATLCRHFQQITENLEESSYSN